MPEAGVSLTRGLVRLIREKPVTSHDLEQAALFTLDALANAIAGRNSLPGRTLLGWAEGRQGDAGRRALLMGALTHILEVDDVHRASVVHTGCVAVPAAFALSAGREVEGTVLLRAILQGFEAMCRVGMAVGPAHYRVWHNTATCGPFGSAMTAAALLGLDEDQAVHALGNAGTQSAGLWEFLTTGAMSKHLHAGRAAEAGVVAAELAVLGFTGPPAILEGKAGFFAGACPDADSGAVLRAPEARWQLHETSIKPWPSCRHTHPVIDGALELAGRIDATKAEAIEITTYGAAVDVCDRPLVSSEYEAKFSLQHCAAAALQRGAMDFAAFGADARAAAAPLAARVTVASGDPFESAYPDAWGARVAVRLTDGSKVEAARTQCRGDPEAALDTAEMIAKARALMQFGGLNDPDALIDAVLGMSRGGPAPDFVPLVAMR
jgi:2-methylcitrate dehydratase PrpD